MVKTEKKLDLNSIMSKTSYFYKAIEERNKQLKEQLKEKEIEIEELKNKLSETVCNGNCYMHKISNRYKQAIGKIKEIVTNETETRILFADEKSFCDFKKILQIINEVEEC